MDKRIASGIVALTLGVSEVKGMPVHDAIDGLSSGYTVQDNSTLIREAYQNGEKNGRMIAKDDFKSGFLYGSQCGLQIGAGVAFLASFASGLFKKTKKDDLWPPNQPISTRERYSAD